MLHAIGFLFGPQKHPRWGAFCAQHMPRKAGMPLLRQASLIGGFSGGIMGSTAAKGRHTTAMPADRSTLEEREAQQLAPWAMRAADSRGRDHHAADDPWRTCFQRDRDRIIHSHAFRRLAYKTQVFANTQGDLFRSRLTHTMEVAQLARSAARRLALNEDLVECISLVHDLGHPPFGHRGEDLLAELMADYGGFEHNLQALRIVEELEWRYPEFPGLNLSYEVRESIVKHAADKPGKHIPRRFHPDQAALLEACLVDEIDSCTYDCHDIDDGLRAGIIRLDALHDIALWRGAWEQASAESRQGTSTKLLCDRALRILLDAFLTDVVDTSSQRIAAAAIADTSDIRRHHGSPLITMSPSMASAKAELEQWLFQHCYRHWRVNRVFHSAQRVLRDLFTFYIDHPDSLPDEHQDRIDACGLHRTVSDYLAGMTDRFAIDEHRQLMAL
ncbi:MAG: deoxyguanosinetriphosphate triphosphohydrolase [Planctomycetota bacterium]|nr:MAG: deoxyguanosinetriphosphate triphosphohydrolase [Planctomycetota bacterium]